MTDLLNVRDDGSLGHDVKELDPLYHFLFTFTLTGQNRNRHQQQQLLITIEMLKAVWKDEN